MKFKSKLKRWIAAGVAGVMMGVIGGFLPGLAPEVGAPMTAEAAGTYVPRTTEPSRSDPNYFSNNPYYQSGYGLPNCTCYAYGRAMELLGYKPDLSRGNADEWWDYNKSSGAFPYGTVPKLGAIACWSTQHVAVVEAIDGDTVWISESSYPNNYYPNGIYFRYISKNRNSMGSGFQGYIYIGDWTLLPEGHVMTKEEAAGQSLPDGDYWIRSELKDTSYVSVASNANTMYGTVCIKNYTGTPSDSDLFHITYQKDGFYRMKHLGTGNEVTLSGGNLSGSTNVEIWPTLDTPTIQEWSLERAENGYKIRSRGNNFYCDVQGALTDTGTNIVTWSAIDTPSQQAFRFIPKSTGRTVEDGDYWIKAYHSGNSYLYADAGNENAYYENICLKNSNELPDKNEAYRITYQKNGYYKIMHIGTGRYLTVSGGSTKMGANVETWEVLSGSLQDWLIDETSNGIKFRSACNGEYLDITGGEFKTGTNIRMWKGMAQKAQSFALIEASAYSPGDINADGALDVNDVVLLQKWILKVKNTTLKDADAADMNSDGVIDIYDLALLKRKLLQKK